MAAQEGHEHIVVRLLKCTYIDVDAQQKNGGNAIKFAANNGHESTIALLASAGADL